MGFLEDTLHLPSYGLAIEILHILPISYSCQVRFVDGTTTYVGIRKSSDVPVWIPIKKPFSKYLEEDCQLNSQQTPPANDSR